MLPGGRPYQVAKINIMNLNKQAKLFSQGMHPVMRMGPTGKWERIKEKPAYFVSNSIYKNFNNDSNIGFKFFR